MMRQQKQCRRLFSSFSSRVWIGIFAAAIVLMSIAGCKKPSPSSVEASKLPQVTVVYPAYAALGWAVQQPGSMEAFEETSIVPKIAGYVQKWNVDIGDRVKKGDILAKLWVPDLEADLKQKKVEVQQARKTLEVAQAHLASAAAAVEEARAALSRARANLAFWQKHFQRISKLDHSVIDKQVKEETRNQLQSAEATAQEAEARVERAEADRQESEAVRNKDRADVAVAEAAQQKMQTLVEYATLTAPFDGVVTQRNINTGDFVQPPAGPPTAPLYVLHRRDLMRVFVDVPESDAVWIKDGAPARVRVPILQDREFEGKVRRMSYSLKRQTRTLRAEIDLPNPDDLLRSGMYAYAAIQVERSNILTLPASAISTQGDVNEGYQDFCYVWESGKVRRLPIKIGSRGEGRVEVLKKQGQDAWEDFTGEERVVERGISALSDGQEVILAGGEKQVVR
jgi:HlyD family secretion protein